MKGESGVVRSTTDHLQCWDIEGDKIEGESGVTRIIIDELQSWDIQVDKTEGESGVLEVSLMNFILRISKEIKWKVKVVFSKYL